MKILIIGEYSGFAKNLKIGFELLNHEVVVVHEGDSFKKISITGEYKYAFGRNFRLFGVQIRGTWLLRAISQTFRFRRMQKKIYKYFDCAFIVNYEFIRLPHQWWYPRFSLKNINKALKNEGRIFMSSCGDDIVTFSIEQKLRYFMPNPEGKKLYTGWARKQTFNQIKTNIAGVIPTVYVYANAYRNSPLARGIHIYKTIQFPFDATNIQPYNELHDKIVIFHGLNREYKGTSFILEAFDILKAKYPEKISCIAAGKMPFEEYLSVIKEANIIVDQCNSYDYGYNALLGMAQGKVVLSGNEPECQQEFGRSDIPIVNITPDVQDIVQKLEHFILNPEIIQSYGERSRSFIDDFHNPVLVAQEYIKIFNLADK